MKHNGSEWYILGWRTSKHAEVPVSSVGILGPGECPSDKGVT